MFVNKAKADWHRVEFHCGCGVRTEDVGVADAHVTQTGHKMHAQGEVWPDDVDVPAWQRRRAAVGV
ncbi:MAG: hypothetical protein Q8R28_15195 [Dehalococcoidia bacterium]|nr:hypothetical protein [Dehalococcoidia bacterium]